MELETVKSLRAVPLAGLVERSLTGDLDAFGEIVRRFQDMAHGYAYATLGDFHLAEDAAQEAFVEAYLKLEGLREPRAFPGWFRRIVFTQCHRIMRRRRVETVPLGEAAAMAAREPSPAESAERSEIRRIVGEAVRSLPEAQREATTLFYINGYSQSEIAEFLEVPVKTVQKRLHDSRRKLKARMMTMVEETLKSNAPDERFSERVIEELLNRPRPLQIPGHPVQAAAEAMRAAFPDYCAVEGEELVAKAGTVAERMLGGDTYETAQGKMLRPHTTDTLVSAMKGRKPPVLLFTAGRVFRAVEKETPQRLRAFHQVEILCVEAGANPGTMTATLRKAIQAALGNVEIRLRDAHFVCFERCSEADVRGADVWVEVAGCGMMSEELLREGGFDPAKVAGFSIGIGLERLAMEKLGIREIAALWRPP